MAAQQPKFGEPSSLSHGKATAAATKPEPFMKPFTNAANYNAFNIDPKTSDLTWSQTQNGDRRRLPSEDLPNKSLNSSVPPSFTFGTSQSFTFGASQIHSEPPHSVSASQPLVGKRALSVECTHDQLFKRLRGEQHLSPASVTGSADRDLHRGGLGHNGVARDVESYPKCPTAPSHGSSGAAVSLAKETPVVFAVDGVLPAAKPSADVQQNPSSVMQAQSVNSRVARAVGASDNQMLGSMDPARAALLRAGPPSSPEVLKQEPVGPLRSNANCAPLGFKGSAAFGSTSQAPVTTTAPASRKHPKRSAATRQTPRGPQGPVGFGLPNHGPPPAPLPLPQTATSPPRARPALPPYITPSVDRAGEMHDRGANDMVVDVIHGTLGVPMVHPKQLQLRDKIIAAVQELGLRGHMPLPREQNWERLINASVAAEIMCPWLDYIGPQDSATILRRADELRSHMRNRRAPGS